MGTQQRTTSATDSDKLRALMNDLAAMVTARFTADGDLQFMLWLLEDKTGFRTMVAMPASDNNKDTEVMIMRHTIRRFRAVRYAFAVEVWVAEEDGSGLAPSQRETRSEGMMITGEEASGERLALIYPIERDEAGARMVAVPDETTEFGGRFTGLFGGP